ncbi:membrane protein insertion efficiency factor YidD [Candidatus Gracilibacteria bacterium]|nr:membrane protein insertion efficiency factor YidD [Candidatus Gracilibacteria bacterium]
MNIIQKILINGVRFYQKIFSPDHSFWARGLNHTPYCKHIPSCSDYMIEALEKKGVIRGLFIGIYRILRCNPWSKGGYDPVDK